MTQLASQNKEFFFSKNAILHERMKTCKFGNGNVNMGFLENRQTKFKRMENIFNVCTQPKQI